MKKIGKRSEERENGRGKGSKEKGERRGEKEIVREKKE